MLSYLCGGEVSRSHHLLAASVDGGDDGLVRLDLRLEGLVLLLQVVHLRQRRAEVLRERRRHGQTWKMNMKNIRY